ncbi:MAG: hypothetical protein NUV76_12160 [Candidatus Kuenenia sp.]|nr:hypothetical protein [Candidatus Kuenenia sp.]
MPYNPYNSNFRVATEDEDIEDEEYPSTISNTNISIPKIRAWHPSSEALSNIKTQQSAFSNATPTPASAPVSSSTPSLEQQDNLPAAMAKPSFRAFFKNLGKDKQSALGQAALAAGFSLMSTPPSRYPISFGQQIGQAGMAGMQQYGSAMQNAREMEMENKLFGLKEREVAAREPYYAAQTEALKMGKPEFTVAQALKRRSDIRLAIVRLENSDKPLDANTALVMKISGMDVSEGALLNKEAKDNAIEALTKEYNYFDSILGTEKKQEQTQLFPSADNIGEPELSQSQIDTSPDTPGVFTGIKEGVKKLGKVLLKGATYGKGLTTEIGARPQGEKRQIVERRTTIDGRTLIKYSDGTIEEVK